MLEAEREVPYPVACAVADLGGQVRGVYQDNRKDEIVVQVGFPSDFPIPLRVTLALSRQICQNLPDREIYREVRGKLQHRYENQLRQIGGKMVVPRFTKSIFTDISSSGNEDMGLKPLQTATYSEVFDDFIAWVKASNIALYTAAMKDSQGSFLCVLGAAATNARNDSLQVCRTKRYVFNRLFFSRNSKELTVEMTPTLPEKPEALFVPLRYAIDAFPEILKSLCSGSAADRYGEVVEDVKVLTSKAGKTVILDVLLDRTIKAAEEAKTLTMLTKEQAGLRFYEEQEGYGDF